jgi:hypothetical protein
MAGKTVKTDLLFYFVLTNGSDKQVPIVIGKSLNRDVSRM